MENDEYGGVVIHIFTKRDPEGYVDIIGVERIGLIGDLREEDTIGIAEHIAQSDWGQIDFPNAIVAAIEGEDTEF